nr:major facilitator superfamily transporter [Candidatus Pantoea persica]
MLVELGALLTGCSFSLIFPALSVEAVKHVARQDQGSALGVYSAFLDLGLGLTGPVAGLLIGYWGMQSVYLATAIIVMGACCSATAAQHNAAPSAIRTARRGRRPAAQTPAASGSTPLPGCAAWPSADRLAAMLPATPDESTCVVETGRPKLSAAPMVAIATSSALAHCA